MITKDQLSILQDMFANCDEEWLLLHLSIKSTDHRSFAIEVDKGNWQDCDELFPGEYSSLSDSENSPPTSATPDAAGS